MRNADVRASAVVFRPASDRDLPRDLASIRGLLQASGRDLARASGRDLALAFAQDSARAFAQDSARAFVQDSASAPGSHSARASVLFPFQVSSLAHSSGRPPPCSGRPRRYSGRQLVSHPCRGGRAADRISGQRLKLGSVRAPDMARLRPSPCWTAVWFLFSQRGSRRRLRGQRPAVSGTSGRGGWRCGDRQCGSGPRGIKNTTILTFIHLPFVLNLSQMRLATTYLEVTKNSHTARLRSAFSRAVGFPLPKVDFDR